nr:hypothetical protein [Tanacetum cinerariifolium]
MVRSMVENGGEDGGDGGGIDSHGGEDVGDVEK